jgi:hypothetical protein
MGSIFPAVNNTERIDNGTNAASITKNKVQLPLCVMDGTNTIHKIVPNTAAAQPSHSNDPTDFPESKSLGMV